MTIDGAKMESVSSVVSDAMVQVGYSAEDGFVNGRSVGAVAIRGGRIQTYLTDDDGDLYHVGYDEVTIVARSDDNLLKLADILELAAGRIREMVQK